MSESIYRQLAQHLDNLPGGYPPTDSGVELRILRRLFTQEQAELAMHLTLIAEEARVIARRAKIPTEEAARRLEEMALKGLIFGLYPEDSLPQYMAIQYAVGIWEFQVHHLEPELVQDMQEYWPTFFDPDTWRKGPQLRTIPVRQSINAQVEVMPYEQAGNLVRSQDTIAVNPCICRREHRLLGEGCDHPEETCMVFGDSARTALRNSPARAISQQEALDLLDQANEAGLVLQPSNAKDAAFICCCCGCSCGVLRNIKRHPKPATIVSSPFVAALNADTCKGCGTCTDRCQMEALRLAERKAVLDLDRCIGCGLCVTTCPTHSLTLARKPASEQAKVPKDIEDTLIKLGRERGKLSSAGLVKMLIQSKVDRLLAPR